MADINQFTLADATSAAAATYVSLGAFTLTGDTEEDPLAVGTLATGVHYRVSTDGGTTYGGMQSEAGSVSLGNKIEVFGLSSATAGATLARSFTVGTVTDSANITTASEAEPDYVSAAARVFSISSAKNNGLPESGDLFRDGAGRVAAFKSPAAVLDYTWDWSAWLADGDTIEAVDVAATGGLTATQTYTSTTEVVLTISGGTLQTPAHITCRATTTGGRVDERTIYFLITER